jgi:serine protease AprX
MWQSAAALIAALVLAAPADAAQYGQKLDDALRTAKRGGEQRVIIRSQPGRFAELRQALRSCDGLKMEGDHASIDAVTAEVTGECLQKLIANDVIDSVGSDAEVAGNYGDYADVTTVPSNPLRSTLGSSDYATGAGIGVAVIDSGIAPLAAFSGRIVGFYDFTNGGVTAAAPNDEYGHGTHVAGLIGAYDAEYMGVAPQVRLLGLKVLDKSGKGAPATSSARSNSQSRTARGSICASSTCHWVTRSWRRRPMTRSFRRWRLRSARA